MMLLSMLKKNWQLQKFVWVAHSWWTLLKRIKSKKDPPAQHAEDFERCFAIENETNSKNKWCKSECQDCVAWRYYAQINKKQLNSLWNDWWHSLKTLWSKCSNNNKAETAYDLVLKYARENIALLQVRGNMSVKNMLLAKNMTSLRNSTCGVNSGGRSAHGTRT